MKKQLLLAMALMVSLTAFSQKTRRIAGWKISRDIPQNEIKLNLATGIFALYPEVSYERIINSDLSLGASVGAGFDNDAMPFRVLFIPHVRWFFGGDSESLNKYGAGFFIEANGGLMSRDTEKYEFLQDESRIDFQTKEGVFGAGLGLAIGWKYLTPNNWIGEIYMGGGRDFVNDDGYPRVGISIGKRF